MADVVGSLTASKTGVETIVYIIRTVRNVQRFERECQGIQKLVGLIQNVFDSFKAANIPLETTDRVQNNLCEVKDFVIDCTQKSSFAQRAWEVIWRKRLPRLMAGLQETVLWFLMDAAAHGVMVQELLLDTSRNIHDTVIGMKATLDQLAAKAVIEEKGQISNRTAAEWDIEFPLEDKRLKVSRDDKGTLAGTVQYHGLTSQVILHSISNHQKEDPFGGGPRHVRIYSKLSSANTAVERFHGLAELETGNYYVVMEDLRSAKSLGASLQDTAKFEDVKLRIRMAYELAKAIAFLHSVRILVRSLSDETVKLVQRDGKWKPVLTNLGEARLLFEDTLEQNADMRFEAPEYHDSRVHSQETDTWSFGVLLWELLNLRHPFGHPEPVFRSRDAEAYPAVSIIQQLQNGGIPWTRKDNTPFPGLSVLVTSCCHPEPRLRQPMSSVVRSLCMLMRDDPALIPTPSQDQEETKVRVHSYLAKRKLVDKRDVDVLRDLSDKGDPVASAILGAAYWRGMVALEDEDLDGETIITFSPEDRDIERKALRALPLLTFAATAGKGEDKSTVKDITLIHKKLCTIYGNHYQQLASVR
ncbi:kinase-like protein [Atractiella rhizophila]|nr:kinase-like protein [Atractiella rhizophila]